MTTSDPTLQNHYPTIHKVPESGPWNMQDYDKLYQQFAWTDIAKELKLPRENGINQATVCIDGHPAEVMNRTALIWRSASGQHEHYTFNDLKRKTNQFANALKDLGIQK